MARRRRGFAPKRRSYKTNNNLGSLNPISQRYICKMKYAEAVNSDAAGLYAFNLNSIFDPNRTGVGHQPYGHDTLSILYNRYRVISCSYRVIAQTSANTAGLQITALPSNVISFALVLLYLSEMDDYHLLLVRISKFLILVLLRIALSLSS